MSGPSDPPARASDATPLVRRTLIVVGIVVAVVGLLLVLSATLQVVLLVFAGLLLAVLLDGLAGLLHRRLPLGRGWALALVVLALIGAAGLAGWLLAPEVARQFDQLLDNLPIAITEARQALERHEWGRRLLAAAPGPSDLVPAGPDAARRLTGIFSTTFGLIAGVVIVLFLGLYLAAEPDLYVGGLLRLVPLSKRARARVVLRTLGQTLWWWLLGRLASMAFVGVAVAIGLWLLGTPLALALGLLAALLDFIPNLGPWLAATPAILLALMQSPTQALHVGLLYLVIQQAESYLVTPLVERQTVSLPPALTFAVQVMLGVLVGLIGVTFASPLTAAGLVLTRLLYVEDVLGDTGDRAERREEPASGARPAGRPVAPRAGADDGPPGGAPPTP